MFIIIQSTFRPVIFVLELNTTLPGRDAAFFQLLQILKMLAWRTLGCRRDDHEEDGGSEVVWILCRFYKDPFRT